VENLGLELTLQDKVSSSANKAAASLKRVDEEAKKAGKSLDFSGELEKVEARLKRLKADPKGFQALKKAQSELREEQKKLQEGGFFKGLFSWAGPQGIGRIGAHALGEIIADTFMEGVKKAVEFFTEGVKKVFEEGAKAEQLALGFKATLGERGGEEAESDVGRYSKLIGIGSEAAARQLLQLRNAGFDQQGARTAHAIATDIAARQGRAADEGAIGENVEALARIRLKGGLTRKQLSSFRITQADEFYKELGQKLGVGAEQAEKIAEKGGKYTQTILNLLGTKAANGGEIGRYGVEGGATMLGRWNRLKDLPNEYLRKLSKSAGWKQLEDKIGDVLKGLDPESPSGKKIMASLMNAFNGVAAFVQRTFTAENIDSFGRALAGIPDVLDKIVTGLEVLATIWAGKQIVDGFASLSTVLLTGNPLLIATAAAVGSIAYALKEISDLGGFKQLADDIDYFTHKQKVAGSGSATKEQVLGARVDSSVASDSERVTYEILKSKKREGGSGGAPISVTVPNIAVNVHPAKDDTQHTGQAVGVEVHKSVVAAVARATQEMGH
jgi:hypothetical protein